MNRCVFSGVKDLAGATKQKHTPCDIQTLCLYRESPLMDDSDLFPAVIYHVMQSAVFFDNPGQSGNFMLILKAIPYLKPDVDLDKRK